MVDELRCIIEYNMWLVGMGVNDSQTLGDHRLFTLPAASVIIDDGCRDRGEFVFKDGRERHFSLAPYH